MVTLYYNVVTLKVLGKKVILTTISGQFEDQFEYSSYTPSWWYNVKDDYRGEERTRNERFSY